MKWIATLYQGGKTFTEEVHANDAKAAREVAQNLNKYAKIVGLNVSFK